LYTVTRIMLLAEPASGGPCICAFACLPPRPPPTGRARMLLLRASTPQTSPRAIEYLYMFGATRALNVLLRAVTARLTDSSMRGRPGGTSESKESPTLSETCNFKRTQRRKCFSD